MGLILYVFSGAVLNTFTNAVSFSPHNHPEDRDLYLYVIDNERRNSAI
jgi:hypothetical protein